MINQRTSLRKIDAADGAGVLDSLVELNEDDDDQERGPQYRNDSLMPAADPNRATMIGDDQKAADNAMMEDFLQANLAKIMQAEEARGGMRRATDATPANKSKRGKPKFELSAMRGLTLYSKDKKGRNDSDATGDFKFGGDEKSFSDEEDPRAGDEPAFARERTLTVIDDETEFDGDAPSRADSAIERATLMWSRIAKLKKEEERFTTQLIREVDSYADEAETELGHVTSHAGSGSEEKKAAESDRGTTFRNTFGTIRGDADEANSVGYSNQLPEMIEADDA